jgi:beta-lactamase regulating signal transducer with metallopeptidase domain
MTRLVEIGVSNAVMATALAVLAAALSRLCRRPAFAHALWLLVLAKLVTPPLVGIPVPVFAQPDAPALAVTQGDDDFPAVQPEELAAIDGARAHEDIELVLAVESALDDSDPEVSGSFVSADWALAILSGWLTGSLLYLGWILACAYRFQRLLRFARPADLRVQGLVIELADRLHLRRPPLVWLVPGAVSPMLWAFAGRARLLFPAQLANSLDHDKLRALLAHELAHWHRRDHWVRFFELVVQVIYWWHPAVWWFRAELHEAEEQCCDAWVVAALAGAERTYALALLETAAFVSQIRPKLPATASGIGRVPHLRRRLTMIMSGRTPKTLGWTGCFAVACLGVTLLPLIPVRAQDNERRERRVIDVTAQDAQVEAARSALAAQLENLRSAVRAQNQAKPASIDEQIEALRRVLQSLEEQKRKEQGPGRTSANPEDVKKAQDEVAKLSQIVADKRRDLARAEAALQRARARLGELGVRSVTVRGRDERVRQIPLKLDVVRPMNVRVDTIDLPRGVTVAPSRDLSQRLDRLLREVEELRREIRERGSRRTDPSSALPK